MEINLIGIGVQTVVFLAGGYAMLVRNDTMIKGIREELSEMEKEMKSLASVLTQIAVQTTRIDLMGERLNIIDRRVDEMRHGQGFVQHKADREY